MLHTSEKMQIVPLHTLASLTTGLYLQPSPQGETHYIQARHFNSDGTFDSRIQPEVHLDARQSKHLLLPGDILFACKGLHHFATLYQPTMGRAVASSIFLVIRVQPHAQVLPGYLVWYLNHPETQSRFRTHARPGSVSSLTLQAVADLEVRVPALSKQSTLLQVEALRRKEMALRSELQCLRENHIQTLLLQSIR